MLNKYEEIERKIIFEEPMKKHTSFKIGGNAESFIKVETIEELKQTIKYAKEKNLKMTIIGNGSNTLVLDKGIKGLVIKIDIKNLNIIQKDKDVEITVGAGYKLMELGIKLKNQGITGFEELSGIPGSIGGAIYMNAGAYGKEMKDVVKTTKCMDMEGNIFELSNKEQKFFYRTSIFKKSNYIILETRLKASIGQKEEIEAKMLDFVKQRKEKQPIEYPSAGSTFKRKEGVIVAKLIDECNLKGYRIGGAKVSEKHAGFIINYKDATAKDVLDLINLVKKKVYEKYKIAIEEEINIIGE